MDIPNNSNNFQSGACCAPIHYAIMKENMELFKLLVSKKCDVNNPDDINGNSPLFLATTLQQLDTMKALIAAGADVNLVDWDGKTPAHYAAYAGFGEELHLLCTSKADLSVKDGAEADGITALESAEKVNKENEYDDNILCVVILKVSITTLFRPRRPRWRST